jgi:RNA-binding protein
MTQADESKMAELSSRARQRLKALANPLKPVVQVGSAGVSASVVEAVDTALEDHELIKIKLGKGIDDDRRALAAQLAETTRAHVCQVIGRVVVLYRPRDRDLPGRPRIALPD